MTQFYQFAYIIKCSIKEDGRKFIYLIGETPKPTQCIMSITGHRDDEGYVSEAAMMKVFQYRYGTFLFGRSFPEIRLL